LGFPGCIDRSRALAHPPSSPVFPAPGLAVWPVPSTLPSGWFVNGYYALAGAGSCSCASHTLLFPPRRWLFPAPAFWLRPFCCRAWPGLRGCCGIAAPRGSSPGALPRARSVRSTPRGCHLSRSSSPTRCSPAGRPGSRQLCWTVQPSGPSPRPALLCSAAFRFWTWHIRLRPCREEACGIGPGTAFAPPAGALLVNMRGAGQRVGASGGSL